MAIATRWRMPPENWCGYPRKRSSGEGMPTRTSVARARSSASVRDTLLCARIASIICVSIRNTGLSVIIGSWKIIAMRLPRTCRIASGDSIARSRPSKRIVPPTMRPGASINPMIEYAVIDLPDPDSPTSATTSPRATSKLTSSTARTTPPRVKKWVRRPWTASSGSLIAATLG